MKTNENLGRNPAFPIELQNGEYEVGMSKRFYAACAAMQGLLAAQKVDTTVVDAEWTAKVAFLCADRLLEKENL